MPLNAYVSLDGIKGECTVKGWEGWCKIDSFVIGTSMEISPLSGGAGLAGGTSRGDDLVLSMEMDKAVSELQKECSQGKKIDEVVLDMWYSYEGEMSALLKVTLTPCILGSVSVGDAARESGGRPVVSFSVAYEKAEWCYTTIEDEEVCRNFNFRTKESE